MVSRKRLIVALVALGVLAFAPPLTAALAQSPAQVVINYPEISEGPNSVSLGLYFTVLDASGQVIPEPRIASVDIHLGEVGAQPASFEQPTSQAYIVLVLDASGSMANAMPQMRQAAIQAVQNAPQEAVFAVIQFNNNITLIQDFSSDRRQVTTQIDTIRAVQNSGTCLYDGVYRAIELLNAAPFGRRGVILFTDGNDVTLAGTPCSTHTYSEVIEFATRQTSRVPVHTIGLSTGDPGGVNEDELRDMAARTGGLSEVGEASSLSLLFQRIINALSYQWLARADVYPRAGENSAWLTITLEDGSTIQSNPIVFTASRAYAVPPGASVNSITYTSSGDVIFDLALTNAERVSLFSLQVVDVRDNIRAPAFSADVTETLQVAASNFERGSEYELVITGQDAAGQSLFETTYRFRYNPNIAEGEMRVMAVQLEPDVPQFVVEVLTTNIEGVAAYQVWLNDQRTNTVVPGSRFTTEPAPVITIPLDGIRNGSYTIVINALSADGQVLAEATYKDALFRSGMAARLGRVVRRSIPFLIVLLVVMVAGAGVLVKLLVVDRRKRQQPAGVLLENTMIRRAGGRGGLDDWSEDAIRLNKQRLRDQAARQRGPAEARPAPRQEQPRPPAPAPAPPPAPPAAAPSTAPSAPTAGRLPRARLIVVQSPEGRFDGAVYAVSEAVFSIGRAGSTLNLDVPSISRQHAAIRFRDGRFVIQDDGSTNGTTVDGRLITGQGEIPLASGAQIGLGKKLLLRFEVE